MNRILYGVTKREEEHREDPEEEDVCCLGSPVSTPERDVAHERLPGRRDKVDARRARANTKSQGVPEVRDYLLETLASSAVDQYGHQTSLLTMEDSSSMLQ